LLEKHARVPDFEALKSSCQQPLHPQAIKGLEAFNRGEYFDAHEYLEEAWMDDDSVGRDLYRGVLQISVAYYHIRNNNYRGAAKMLLRVRQWIEPIPDFCRGINLDKLRQEAYTVHDRLLELGPERLDEFDHSLMKPVQYQLV
jgi:predicted metal-dependent hydrolase